MSKPKPTWGLFLFCSALILVAGSVLLFLSYPAHRSVTLYQRFLPALLIFLSLGAFLIGHFSYPRVHNLKIYLIGYLSGLHGLIYGLLALWDDSPPQAIHLLSLLSVVNVLTVLFIPAFAKYRITTRITWSILALEGLIIAFGTSTPASLHWLSVIFEEQYHLYLSLFFVLFASCVCVVSVRTLRNEFHFGGILSATALIYAFAWGLPPLFMESHYLQMLLLTVIALFLNAGIIIHSIARMEHRMSYDPLLHIYNRNFCSRIIAEQSSINSAAPLTIAMIDIDHFKKVNDTHGHEAGDHVLQAVAQTIQQEVIPDGIACRYGGEEIIVFFPRKVVKEVVPIVENLRLAIESLKIATRKKRLSVTVSCGVACREENTQTIMDVINCADKALYRAKHGGRNQVKSGKISPPKTAKK